MKPSYWGKYFWKVIHISALGYPMSPTQNDKETYALFYELIGKVLPCKKCVQNYARHFKNIPIEYFLDNKNDLFKWTVHLHNTVNKEVGKPQWSVEFAKHFYLSQEKASVSGGNTQKNNTFYVRCGNKMMIFINLLTIVLVFVLLWKMKKT